MRKRSSWLTAVVAIALASAGIWAANSNWVVETVVSGGAYYANPVAISPASHEPGIVTNIGGSGKLGIAERAGGVWATQTIVSGSSPDFEYDASGRPCVSYRAATGKGEIRYAFRSGSKWTLQTVDASTTAEGTSLAFHPVTGQPAIAYVVSGGLKKPNQIRLARWTGSAWSIQSVESVWRARFASVAYAANGDLAIAYPADANNDGSLDSLRCARLSGSAWTVEVVQSGERAGANPSAAYDPVAGEFAIAYGSSSDVRGLRLARRPPTGWVVTQVDLSPYVFDPRLAFDVTGRAYIGYISTYDNGPWDLRLTWSDDGVAWSSEAVESASNLSAAALTIDPTTHVPILTYWGNGAFPDLRFARRTAIP